MEIYTEKISYLLHKDIAHLLKMRRESMGCRNRLEPSLIVKEDPLYNIQCMYIQGCQIYSKYIFSTNKVFNEYHIDFMVGFIFALSILE